MVMKKKGILLFTIFSMCGFVACSSENNENNTFNVGVGSDTEVVTENVATGVIDEPIVEVTAEPVEPTQEPVSEETEATAELSLTEAPVTEITPEPTKAPELYPGIDMESDLTGQKWIETFIGVVDVPKLVVFSDETGRKEIISEGTKVPINPDSDVLAVYLPEAYEFANKTKGISDSTMIDGEYYKIFYLDSNKTREKKFKNAAVYVKCDGEEIALEFILKSE